MARYSVAEAKNNLPRLIDKAIAGEQVVITRHGKPVAELKMPAKTDVQSFKAMTAWLASQIHPPVGISAVDVLNDMYDEDGC